MKKCFKCEIEKEYTEFHFCSRSGYKSRCKDCRKNDAKAYYLKNKEIIVEKTKNYYLENKEEQLEARKLYRELNRSEILSNKKNDYLNNKEKYRAYRRVYEKNRRNNDILYKLKKNVKNLIYRGIVNNGYKKDSRTFEILGCSHIEFKVYLESKFEPWMTWDNYGKYNGEFNYGWDIDHIIPISSANDVTESLNLNHYLNLQPLCSKINRDIKKDRLNYGNAN